MRLRATDFGIKNLIGRKEMADVIVGWDDRKERRDMIGWRGLG